MINIDKGVIHFNGTKQDIINDFVCILSNFVDIAKLDNKETKKIADVASDLILRNDIKDTIEVYRIDQKNDFMNLFYEEFKIKRVGQ